MADQDLLITSDPAARLKQDYQWTAATSNVDHRVVDHFRRKLKYFFMSPCEKYRARGRKPWKLMLQILKILLITGQLVSFGLSNEMMVTFKEENIKTLKHLFLKGYEDQDKNYAVYTSKEVYAHINYIINQYMNLPNLTVGNHAYEKNDGVSTPLSLCQEFYRHGSISPGNDTFDIDPFIEKECLSIYPLEPVKDAAIQDMNFTLDFKRLLSVKVYLIIKTINLQTVRHNELPDCYAFRTVILFDNTAHSGRIKISLDNHVQINVCKDWNISGSSDKDYHLTLILTFDSFIILACLVSLILCIRSVLNGLQLQSEYAMFFQKHYQKTVSMSDRLEFVNGWYILIIISDTLTITGSVMKIGIQTKELTNYDVCSILLGTSTMFVWIGVLRYLGFFQKYNILILTLRAAFPNVIRFLTCAVMIYLSYCFCGWIVLGPHHENFRTFNMVADCLFSLINGDEIYSTFTKLRGKKYLVWLFSRLYVYTFISLFTYMVLSLFIALITDTYETIKQQQQEGIPASELQAFIMECKDLPASGKYNDPESDSCLFFPCACCS
ncbi:mucolipin-3 isoform X1 [Alosa sapidissima]|uniref:mucolipin-3 isoform X1 n=1 Tax=Alosa sapidissima TaxID=34773 RepID=UPI001C08F262|nr:mucolipin-3 isoform X1 [Alosa sapidissima]